jgi:hypothetical protein
MQVRKFMLTGLTVLATTAAASALAADTGARGTGSQSWLPYTSYGYVGGSIGRTDYEQDNCLLFCDDRTWGGKLFTGGQVNQYFGVELGYVYLGEVDRNGGDIRAQGLNLSLVGHIPVSDQFKLFGKVGTIWGFTRTRAPAGQPSGHEDSFRLSYGLGLQVDVNRNWAVRGDWDRYRFEYPGRKDDADLYSIGLVYKF